MCSPSFFSMVWNLGKLGLFPDLVPGPSHWPYFLHLLYTCLILHPVPLTVILIICKGLIQHFRELNVAADLTLAAGVRISSWG